MLFRVMQSCTNKVIFTYKEQVSQDLKDGFPTCLLLTRYLYLEITYIIQGYSTEDLRPKGAVTPPPYSPPPSSGALCRLSLFQPLPGLTEVGTREREGKTRVPSAGSRDSTSQSHRASSACHPITAGLVFLCSQCPLLDYKPGRNMLSRGDFHACCSE